MKKVLHLFQCDKGLFLCLFFVAAVLRFFNGFDIPFVHDELSALNRIQFDSIADVVAQGVKEQDNHPALIQVFLFYWTHLFGESEFAVKLPFLIMGLGSVYLVFRISSDWFNSTSALFTSAFMASLQFPIMYSQIARPYISGLFFSLLFVMFWTQFLFKNSKSKRTLIGLILSASLCSYNHYFSLMFAGIVGITGLFFLNKSNAKTYLLTMFIAVCLFIPHLEILLYQMGNKGLNWLGTPTPLFFVDHLRFIFHFNTFAYLLPAILFGVGLAKSKKIKINKFQWISVIWFILPIIVGISYSIIVKPIIQHSMLIFTFPYLLFFISSFLPNLSIRWKQIGVLSILMVNTLTLVFAREHYKVYYAQPFQEIFNFSEVHYDKLKPKVIINENPAYLSRYFSTKQIEFTSTFRNIPSPIQFRNQLVNTAEDHLILGNLPANLVEVAKESYPTIISSRRGLNHDIILLSRTKETNGKETNVLFESKYATNNSNKDWKVNSKEPYIRHFSEFLVPSENEFGPVFERSLEGLEMNRFSKITVNVDFRTTHLNNGLLVISLYHNAKEVMWKGISLDEYQDSEKFNEWTSAYLSATFTSVIKSNNDLLDYRLKILYWNKDKVNITLKNFELKIEPGNPYEFATIEPIW